MDLYREEIIDHYQHPRNYGRLKKSSVSHEEANSFCGDKIRMDLEISSDQLKDVAFEGVGCAIIIASASILTELVKGKELNEIRAMESKDLIDNLKVELTLVRLKCALLPWEVLQKGLEKYGKI